MLQPINEYGSLNGDKKSSLMSDENYLQLLAETHPHFCSGQTLTRAPFFTASIAPEGIFPKGLMRAFLRGAGFFCRALKAPRMLVIGIPFEPYDQSEIINFLPSNTLLKQLAHDVHADGIMLINISRYENYLSDNKFTLLPSFPDCIISLRHATFTKYISSLPKKYRLNIVSMMKKFHNAGHRIELVKELTNNQINSLYESYNFMYQKAKVPWLSYDKSYFAQLSRLNNVTILCAKSLNDEIIGTLIGFIDSHGFHVGRLMISPHFDRKDGIYFRLLYASIEQAIDQQCPHISFGPTSYRVKRRLGASLKSMQNAVLPIHPLWKIMLFICPQRLKLWLLRHLLCEVALERNY